MTGFTKTPQSALALELVKQKALKTLGIGPVDMFKAVDVMTYYRARARAWHPDASSHGSIEEAYQVNLQELREAKDFLIAYLEDQ